MKKILFLCVSAFFIFNNACAGEQEYKEQHGKKSKKELKHEQQLQQKHAALHSALVELETEAMHGNTASKLVLDDVQMAMEHPDYSLQSPRTLKALPFVKNYRFSADTIEAFHTLGKQDTEDINHILNNY